MDAILGIIDDALKRKGLSDAAASKLAVGHPSLIKNLRMPRNGEKRYNLPSLMRLADVLDLEFYFGPHRPVPVASQLRVATNVDPSVDAPQGFLIIPWLNPRMGMASAPMAFSREWLDRNHLTPDFLQAVVPDVVELELVPAKDTVALLDTRTIHRTGHGLWCFRDAGKVQIAHITFRGSVTVIYPASVSQDPRVIDGPPGGAIEILGKVVWLGQAVPFKGSVR